MPISRDQALELLERVRLLPSWKPVAKRTRAPSWFGEFWTRVCALVAGDGVEWVDGVLALGEDGPSGSLQLFTPHRIVWGTVGPGPDGPQLATWTTSRRTLLRVELTGGTPFFSTAEHADWPGAVRVRAVYPEVVLEMPTARLNHQQVEQFEEFLSSLVGDLGCGRGSRHEPPEHRRPGWAW